MRVAYLVNQYPRVSHTFIRREILALEKRGIEVLRYSVRKAPEPLSDHADIEEEAKTRRILDAGARGLLTGTLSALTQPSAFVRASQMAFTLGRESGVGGLKHGAYFAEACLLKDWLVANQVQHLHAHFGTNSATVALLARLLGGPPFSFTVHGPEEFDRPAQLGLAVKMEHAKFVAAISSFGRSQLMRWARAKDWSKIHVVRCGLDPNWLTSEVTPITGHRLLNIGRLSEQKGQLLLIEAAGALKRKHPALPFEIRLIGDGELRATLERRTAELGLGEHVKLLGWADEARIKQELASSRALVLPSFAEGLPVVIMEALAQARPVLSTFVAGIPELVDEHCGWLVPPGSVERLTETLYEVLSQPDENLTRLGTAGRSRVAELHDMTRNAAELAELFAS